MLPEDGPIRELLEALAELVAAKVAAKLDHGARSSRAPLPAFISRAQAKKLLGIEVRAFNKAGGELGFVKPGREVLLPTEALLGWIARQQRLAKTDPAKTDPYSYEAFRASRAKTLRRLGGS